MRMQGSADDITTASTPGAVGADSLLIGGSIFKRRRRC